MILKVHGYFAKFINILFIHHTNRMSKPFYFDESIEIVLLLIIY